MIELPGWNDLIFVNGFCYSSSMGEPPKLNIPLKTSVAPTKGIAPATFARNSTATYIDDDGLLRTAGIDVIRFQNGRYLCELAATNRFLQSGTPATQVITVVSGTVYTVQCYGSGSITLSGAGTGSVVEGAPITFTASSTSLTCTVSGSLNRAQVETGTQATSYIPTTSAPVTRAADVLHYAVGDVITQGQGSLYCEFYNEILNSGESRALLCLSDGTSSNRLYFQINSSNFLTVLVVTGGSTVGYPASSDSSVIGLNKVLLTYADNNMRLYLNGTASGEDLSGVINTTMNKLSVGCLEYGATQANRELGNIKYFKEAENIKLTTL